MQNPVAAASPASGPSMSSREIDGAQIMRSGMDLARASQLTMLRLQLALHGSNRRTAMQALDNLLDIDAEMEGLAASLASHPAHDANSAALTGYIGIQRAAIAAEKHVLTGGDPHREPTSIAISPSDDWVDGVDVTGQQALQDADHVSDSHTGRHRWVLAATVALLLTIAGLGSIYYLQPAFSLGEWLL